jgi:hypothetical protein
MPGCGNVIPEDINYSVNSKLITMQINNPHTDFTVTSVQLIWNSDKGKISVEQAQLGTVFWSGPKDNSGTITITPIFTVPLPGYGYTSTIQFTMDKNYGSPGTGATTIKLTLSSAECGTFTVSKTK